MSVGEANGTTLAQTNNLVDDRRHELNMIFNFDAIKLGRSDFGLSQLGVGPCRNLKPSTTLMPGSRLDSPWTSQQCRSGTQPGYETPSRHCNAHSKRTVDDRAVL